MISFSAVHPSFIAFGSLCYMFVIGEIPSNVIAKKTLEGEKESYVDKFDLL